MRTVILPCTAFVLLVGVLYSMPFILGPALSMMEAWASAHQFAAWYIACGLSGLYLIGLSLVVVIKKHCTASKIAKRAMTIALCVILAGLSSVELLLAMSIEGINAFSAVQAEISGAPLVVMQVMTVVECVWIAMPPVLSVLAVVSRLCDLAVVD